MRSFGILGVVLIVVGILVLAARGVSYTKDRDSTHVGPIKVSTEQKGFVPPIAGAIAIIAGVVLVVAGRGKPV
jgi:uncharacterized membrane protein HdeD (DUF308 family)